MIYSKTTYYGRSENPHLDLPIASQWFLHLPKCNFEQDDIFYYDRHDLSIRLEKFDTFINEEHWNHIRNTPTVKILINFSDDYFNILDIERISKVILEKNINPSQVYMLVMDQNFKSFALELFEKLGVVGVNVYHYNVLLKKLDISYTNNNSTNYKFSSLSRNYHPWRLSLYLYFLENDLLDNFTYSFHNFLPYAEQKDISIDEIKEDATKLGYESTTKLNDWIEGLPYDLGNRNSKWINGINDAISNSDFHLLIESHLDPYLFINFQSQSARDKYGIEEFSPAFPTEKTWRVILCKRPFIAASTPYFLKELKQLGFKTFSPFIDESYDNIEDNDNRVSTLLNEIKRIINLPEDERNYIITQCKDICEYNYQLLKIHHGEVKFTNNFEFLKS
jgi:hypothetical protein